MEEDVCQSVGETSINPMGVQRHSSADEDQHPSKLETDVRDLQQSGVDAVRLEFQNSNLSPALALLPVTSGVEHNFNEYSLFQQSDSEFVPLRAYPDVSMTSEKLQLPPQDCTTHSSECGSLSQHPLAQATILSEEGADSCCSQSQHSSSPGNQGNAPMIASIHDRHGILLKEGRRERDVEIRATSRDKLVSSAAEDETFFLSKDVPAQHLLKLLQKEVGMRSSSSSAVSSASDTSVKNIASYMRESKSTQVCSFTIEQSTREREGPPGGACLLQKQIGNITMGSRSTLPDDSSEVLHRKLLSEVGKPSGLEAESKSKATPTDQFFRPTLKELEGKPSVVRANMAGIPWTGAFSAGVEAAHREQDLWSSGNQTGIEGSYLGFLPQSQSTPGVFRAPPKSSVKVKLGQLSAIASDKQDSYQSVTGAAPQLSNTKLPDTPSQCQEDALQTSAEVQSLPSLNYMQKVDAWRANHSSGKSPLFDSLELQGFSGMGPEKKIFDAASDTLNHTQLSRSSQQSPVFAAASHDVAQSASTAHSGSSSSRRGEAVGGAPSDKDNRGPAAQPSASPFGRSQSPSSFDTVVMSAHKHKQTDMLPEKEKRESQDVAHHHSGNTVQPSPLTSFGRFSDVSLDHDLTLSSSQDSYSGVKVVASLGASSVVSLELDNYAPYWTLKPSTPPPLPKLRELNIDERIPLYLRNLGIDQSPSTILTPFVPKGPIREPEFSPTDLCTIKGSTGTPPKSTHPSEGGSPHKEEFSRSSVLSVDSSVSVPFSLDSLGPVASIPERARRKSSPSHTDAVRSDVMAPSPQPDDGACSSVLQPREQQQDSRQDINKSDSDVSASCKGSNSETLLQSSRSVDQGAEDSFVSTNALLEIRTLLSHAENMVSTGSSAASSAPAASHLLSDQDLFLSPQMKTSRLQDSSLPSTSTTGDPRSRFSPMWARSSSDSMLSSEKPRQRSVGQENATSTWQPDPPSTQVTTTPASVAYKMPQDTPADSTVVLSKSARRTEPEGCSAAPPDKVPTQPPSAASTQQLTSAPADRGGVPEEEERPPSRDPAQSCSSSPILEDADQEVMSDGSSDSSLAIRVAKLLQNESPATVVSSTPSMTDQEESKAREWIKLKISGQQCEPLELDVEDRKRIEEIKKELLLRNPIKSLGSTDTESSAASSLKNLDRIPVQSAEAVSSLSDAKSQQGVCTNQPDSGLQTQEALHSDLEARVCEIAAREGVTLPTKRPQAFSPITIAPSPSTSPLPPLSSAPDPLHLTELSTGAADIQLSSNLDEEDRVTFRELPSVYEAGQSFQTKNQTVTSHSAPNNQKRQDTVGGHCEEPPPPSRRSDKEDKTMKHDGSSSFRHRENLSVQTSSVPGADLRLDQSAGPSTVVSLPRTGHVSRIRLAPSPRATDHVTSTVHYSHADAASRLPCKDFVPLRDSSSPPSSLDEGVGSSSPPEWHDTREPVRQRVPERSDSSTLFKRALLRGGMNPRATQSLTQHHRSDKPPRSFTTETPVPVLLPYKPRGSDELFYVPQTEADVSCTELSDTTMESSHTGSDDAVPPRFSSEVLGHQDSSLDRGVTFRHTEGIYSKRLKTAAFKMHEPGDRAADRSSPTVSQTPKTSSQVSAAFTRVSSLRDQEVSKRDQEVSKRDQEVSKRDQGTSPLQFLHYKRTEPIPEKFQEDVVQTSEPQTAGERQQGGTSLDQLWQKFCDGWSVEESHPSSDRDATLLERLERLSRLIHGTRTANVSDVQEEAYHQRKKERKEVYREAKRSERGAVAEGERKIKGGRWTEPPIQMKLQAMETVEDGSRDSLSSSLSHQSSQNDHPSPADESENLSTTSSSMSTVDTARLIRAFGAHKVQQLKSGSSLSKLYNTINEQKEGRERWRGRSRDPLHIITPSETAGTDESVASDSASTTSTYTLTSHHGPSRSLTAKKVNKSIQAGDLEIVRNGTRRHTRDVGTTFPSPSEARTSRLISSSSSSTTRGRAGGPRSPSKSQGVQKQRKNKKSPSKPHPEGVSWFISADDLRSEARKENQPDVWRPSAAWFEPYSKVSPWREPLRQRQVHEDRSKHQAEPDPDPRAKTLPSGRAHVSLQEALQMHRPEFISRSRQRSRHLALQAEERKLQAVFSRERGMLLNQPGGLTRLPKPAGTALLRRAVPRKEMIQRSKQIYETLPEVRRRRDEERRKAEYQSYRLNAQLYNKRITNRVLGRRTAWQ